MQTLLDRDKKGNERNYEWKKEVHDRSCYRTRKKGCSMWVMAYSGYLRIAHYESCMLFKFLNMYAFIPILILIISITRNEIHERISINNTSLHNIKIPNLNYSR